MALQSNDSAERELAGLAENPIRVIWAIRHLSVCFRESRQDMRRERFRRSRRSKILVGPFRVVVVKHWVA